MYKQFTVIICFFAALTSYVYAQQKTSGVIYYEQVIDLKASAAQAQAAGSGQPNASFNVSGSGFTMPDKITNKMELVFSPAGAKFQRSTVEEDAAAMGGGGGPTRVFMMGGGGAGGRTYFDFAAGKATSHLDFNGQEYLIENALGSGTTNAEKSEETKKIAGFTCKKAVVDGPGGKTTIWYTTDLPIKASPMPALWTEGLVLAIENERMKFVATGVEYMKIKDTEFALPKKATTITQEEFNQKMEEFRKSMPTRGGTIRIGG